jgi:GntR family transcriptional repressor for pyruvate dehydrogenase complex
MHREIYRAIRSHNPAQARLTMEQHLKLASDAQKLELDQDTQESAEKTPAQNLPAARQ